METRRRIARLAAPVAATLVAAGCIAGTSGEPAGDDGQTKGGKATVEFWTINLKKNYNDYIQGMIDEYEKKHPKITIDWVDVPGQDIKSKFLASLAAGNVPDAVNIESTRVDAFADSLTDLSAHFDEDELADYQDGLLDSLRRDGQLLAIPWYNGGGPVAWYNKEILDKAGVSADDLPGTWQEAFDFGRKIHDATGLCGFNALPDVSVLQSNGVELLNGDKTKAAVTGKPEIADILERWRQAYRDGAICPGAVSKDIRNYPQTVTNGLAASSVNALPFALLDIEENAPDVFDHLVLDNSVVGPTGKYHIGGMQTFVVPQKSDVKEQAAEFIEFVTNGENQLAFCKLVTIFPSTESTLEDPFFTDVEVKSPHDKARKIVIEELPDLVTTTLGTTKDKDLREAWLDKIRAFMNGNQSPEQTLEAISEEWNGILAED